MGCGASKPPASLESEAPSTKAPPASTEPEYVTGVQENRATTAMYANAEPEAPPDPEQLRLHEEFLEEQRERKAQYDGAQKVQAVVKGKAARAEVEAKKAEIAAGVTPTTAPASAETE